MSIRDRRARVPLSAAGAVGRSFTTADNDRHDQMPSTGRIFCRGGHGRTPSQSQRRRSVRLRDGRRIADRAGKVVQPSLDVNLGPSEYRVGRRKGDDAPAKSHAMGPASEGTSKSSIPAKPNRANVPAAATRSRLFSQWRARVIRQRTAVVGSQGSPIPRPRSVCDERQYSRVIDASRSVKNWSQVLARCSGRCLRCGRSANCAPIRRNNRYKPRRCGAEGPRLHIPVT